MSVDQFPFHIVSTRLKAGALVQCTDKACVDIPDQGVYHIQTQTSFPICGCRDADTIARSACGGDAWGGICKGTGKTGLGYQGCPCSTSSRDDPSDSPKVCPEAQGKATQSCSAAACGGDTRYDGVCDSKTDLPNQPCYYTFCACCPDRQTINCNDCGGSNGNGTNKCAGIPVYTGFQYLGYFCTTSRG
jgi:hypothetical protein